MSSVSSSMIGLMVAVVTTPLWCVEHAQHHTSNVRTVLPQCCACLHTSNLDHTPCSATWSIGNERECWVYVAAVELDPLPQLLSFLQGGLQDDWAIAGGGQDGVGAMAVG